MAFRRTTAAFSILFPRLAQQKQRKCRYKPPMFPLGCSLCLRSLLDQVYTQTSGGQYVSYLKRGNSVDNTSAKAISIENSSFEEFWPEIRAI